MIGSNIFSILVVRVKELKQFRKNALLILRQFGARKQMQMGHALAFGNNNIQNMDEPIAQAMHDV